MTSTVIKDLFWLSLILIAVVYFVGFATDSTTIFNGASGLLRTATGRKPDGTFADYPH